VQPEGAPPVLVVNHLNNVVYREGSLWHAHSFSSGELGGEPVQVLRWVQIDVQQWPQSASLVQDGLFGEMGVWCFTPAIMVDLSGNVAIIFARSSATEYPSLYLTWRLVTDARNTLRSARLLKRGTATWVEIDTSSANVGTNRYVDYFGTALDPSDGSIWLFGAYVAAQRERGTWVANVVAPKAAPRDRLQAGAGLLAGQSLTSTSGRYRLLYQSDGNLVLYDDVARTALWASNTGGSSAWEGDVPVAVEN
jgi:hypothetical protein